MNDAAIGIDVVERIKTLEVIATRDEHGGLAVWSKGAAPKLEKDAGVFEREWVAGRRPLAEMSTAKAMIGGTYCGIKKCGMKRLMVTVAVKEVQV